MIAGFGSERVSAIPFYNIIKEDPDFSGYYIIYVDIHNVCHHRPGLLELIVLVP